METRQPVSDCLSYLGRSGVRVTIQGAGEPELTGYGELYANFIYRSGGGSMEVRDYI